MYIMIIICPHCNEQVIIEQINCGIFRHGIIIKTGNQMDPHLDQVSCEKLVTKRKIYGCGKPFRILQKEDNVFIVEKCEYI